MRILPLLLFAPVFAFAEDILVDPMAATKNWELTGQRVCYVLGKSKLEAAKDPVRPGAEGSLKLTYDLDRRYWVGIQWRGEAIPGRVQDLSFWAYGDESKHQLTARMEDANGRRFDIRLGPVDWKGWRKLSPPMDETKWVPVLRYAEEAIPVRWPVKLTELRLSKANSQMLLGSVAFSELRAVSVVQPVDRVIIALRTDAPANVFYPPEPVKIRASFANPTATDLSGRIRTIAVDWLGNERRWDGGPIVLKTGETVEREVSFPASALGAYEAWVQLCVGDGVREAFQRIAVSRRATGPATLDPASPFGMGLYLPRFRTEEDLRQAVLLAREAGVKWTRDGLGVARLEPEPGRWAWEQIRWVAGHEKTAVEFPGGQGFTVSDSPSLDRPGATGEVTFSFWIKFITFDYPDRWRSLLTKGEGAQRQFCFFLTVATRQLGVSFGDGATSWSDVACTKADWKTGQWYHVVMACRHADRNVRWWVDGAPAGQGEIKPSASLVVNTLPLEIGRSLGCGLDDLAIYDRALAPDALASAKPIARWAFDEGQGLRAADSSSNGNHAEIKPFRPDAILEQTQAAGICTYAITMGTPKWMAGRPTEGVDRPWNVIPQLDKWSEAVGEIVARYKQRGIRTWEIWNEPNIEPFWSPKPDPAEYCKVLAASYAAIKKADPDAVVMGCALAGPHGPEWKPPYEFVEEVLKLGGGKSMDAISIHPYRQPRSPEDSQYREDLKAIGDLTEKYGRRLPIWITEVGWPADAGGSSDIWATKMLPRAYLLAIAAGVRNIAWYDYHDDGTDPSYNEHHFGILFYDLTPKSSYFAYRTMATELAGMRFEREVPAGEGATVLLFASDEKRTAVAWSHRKERSLALELDGRKEIETVELMGNAATRPVQDGALLLTLTDAAVFLRNVPPSLAAAQPILSEPGVLKLVQGESGEVRLRFHNPFDKPLVLSRPGHWVEIAPRAEVVVKMPIPAHQAAAWTPPVWRNPDGRIAWPTPGKVVALAGRRDPIFERNDETSAPVSLPHSSALNATDEVTVACSMRSEGPTEDWQTLVSKWEGDVSRNYGLYLAREKGEFCFSASFERGTHRFNDFSSGVSLFDGKWHRVAATYSKHDGEVRLYVDGAVVKKHLFDGGDLKTNTAPISIARGLVNPNVKDAKPRAAVRDIRIWSRALNPEEIAQIETAP